MHTRLVISNPRARHDYFPRWSDLASLLVNLPKVEVLDLRLRVYRGQTVLKEVRLLDGASAFLLPLILERINTLSGNLHIRVPEEHVAEFVLSGLYFGHSQDTEFPQEIELLKTRGWVRQALSVFLHKDPFAFRNVMNLQSSTAGVIGPDWGQGYFDFFTFANLLLIEEEQVKMSQPLQEVLVGLSFARLCESGR